MNHKVPKEIEKVPVVGGLELKTVVIIIISGLLFLFLLSVNFLMALILPVIVGLYVFFSTKFKKEGEMFIYLRYLSSKKVVKFDKTVEKLLNK